MATYSILNFALVEKQFILIYDINGYLRYSINPLESEFYNRHMDCVIENHGNGVDKYIVLDFSSIDEASQATIKLQNLKSSMSYYVEWSNLTGVPSSLSGYGITDAYTKTEIDTKYSGITIDLSGYYTSAQTNANFLSANTMLNESVGITLNNKYIAGVKNYIEVNDILNIPEYYEYNVNKLNIDGTINLDGEINL